MIKRSLSVLFFTGVFPACFIAAASCSKPTAPKTGQADNTIMVPDPSRAPKWLGDKMTLK